MGAVRDQRGNQNARGSLGPRNLDAKEKAARLKADRHLNRITPLAVATLEKILRSKSSTNMDLISASREVLDRKIPKLTSAEIALRDTMPILLRVEGGLGWPEKIAQRMAGVTIPVKSVNGNGHGANGNGGAGA
jgi:hypothetical protein